jgi:pimeloyl-ACP methyl ester carboxylesterase
MTVSLVLLPGLDGTGSLFRPLLRELPDEVEPIVLSYPAREVLDYSALTQLALRSLPTGRPFVLLGESFSGPVAVLAAATQPKGLLGVILCASFVSAPRPWAKIALPLAPLLPLHATARMAGSYVLMGRFTNSEVAELMLAALAQVPGRVLRARLAAAANVDVTVQLRSLDVPTLYLQASEDAVVPSEAAEVFSQVARRSSVEVVVGPHFLLQCVPSAAAKSIVCFIERVYSGV